VNKLGQCVGQTASADVVNEEDGVLVAHRATRVNDFLRAPLHLGVASLHTGKVKVDLAFARLDTGSCAATKTDKHGRSTDNEKVRASGYNVRVLERMLRPDGAHTTCQHNRLVVAPQLRLLLVCKDAHEHGAEVTGGAWAAELVVELGAADGGLEHDVLAAGDVRRLSDVLQLPWAFEALDVQVGDGEARQSSLWLGSTSDGSLVTDLAARARGGSGEGRYRSRVVVRLDLAEDVYRLFGAVPLARQVVGCPEARLLAVQDSSIVAVRADNVLGVLLVGVADHAKQRHGLAHTVDGELGVELLVATVLRVDLGKHEQLDVDWAPLEFLCVCLYEVLNLRLVHGQAQLAVGVVEGGMGAVVLVELDGRGLRRLALAEDGVEVRGGAADGLRHAVVEMVAVGDLVGFEGALEGGGDDHAALDTLDCAFERACARDHGGEGAPWRYRAGAWADVEEDRLVVARLAAAVDSVEEDLGEAVIAAGVFAVVQDLLQRLQLIVAELLEGVDKVHPQRAHFGRANGLGEALQAEVGEGGRARQDEIGVLVRRHRV